MGAPAQNRRGKGEVAMLAALIDSVATSWKIAASNIALVGMSAGAALAANLVVAYPERYGAVAMHSGIAALAASDVAGALAVMRSGPTSVPSDSTLGARALAAMGTPAKGIPVVASGRAAIAELDARGINVTRPCV